MNILGSRKFPLWFNKTPWQGLLSGCAPLKVIKVTWIPLPSLPYALQGKEPKATKRETFKSGDQEECWNDSEERVFPVLLAVNTAVLHSERYKGKCLCSWSHQLRVYLLEHRALAWAARAVSQTQAVLSINLVMSSSLQQTQVCRNLSQVILEPVAWDGRQGPHRWWLLWGDSLLLLPPSRRHPKENQAGLGREWESVLSLANQEVRKLWWEPPEMT